MALFTDNKIHHSQIISENFYSLEIDHQPDVTFMTMTLTIPTVSTQHIPATHSILKTNLPTIFQSMCFNDDELPFAKEVVATEVGHLFEHILLEYLCEEKVARGYDEVEFSGETQWNWREDPRGTFHIMITSTHEDLDIFAIALQKTIILVNKILQSTIRKDIPSIHLEPQLYKRTMARKSLLN